MLYTHKNMWIIMLIYIAGTLAIVTQIQQLKRNKKEK